MAGSKIAITRVEPGNDESFAVALATVQADDAIRNPGDPEIGPQEAEAWFFRPPPDRQKVVLAATIDGEPAGMITGGSESDPDDELQVASIEAMVLPHVRRHGVATALADAVLPAVKEMGQNSVVAYTCQDLETEAAEAMCRHYGLSARQEERCSRVAVADIDESLMSSWIDGAADAASGYRLASWIGHAPDDLIGLWCAAGEGMGDAPMDDIEYNYPTRAVDAQREADEVLVDSGFLLLRTVAIAPGGEAAGLSELWIHRERPQIGHQGDTTVLADHRGHRLGKWLKAHNYRHALAEVPELAVLETYNAQSNDHMLNINVAMGFQPHRVYTAWQASIDEAMAHIQR